MLTGPEVDEVRIVEVTYLLVEAKVLKWSL